MKTQSRVTGLLLVLALVTDVRAQDKAPGKTKIEQRYVKQEYQVPMRDGAKLYTIVYSPRDTSTSYPMLMMRTPYSIGPYGKDRYPDGLAPNSRFSDSGYIFVFQDVRGCFRSEGDFVNMTPHRPNKSRKDEVDESSDTYDTIEWLLKNVDNHNGRVGQWGISYPGFYAAAGMIDAHPALKAVSPQAPISDWWYDDFHHHGALFLPHTFNFFVNFGQPRPVPTPFAPRQFEHGTPDGYQFFLDLGSLRHVNRKHFRDRVPFWNELAAHPNYDSFWQERNLLPHLKKVAPAVLTVGGLFDAEDLYGPLKIYKKVEQENPGIFNALVMGPWVHGGWSHGDGERVGHVHFGAKTARFFRSEIEFPFFEHYLKDAADPQLAEATVFETGANRWRRFRQWPPAGLEKRSLYLQAGGKLSSAEPDEEGEAFDEYVSDPARPVPFTEAVDVGMTVEYMTDDQRFAARRPDVLVYQTEPLKEDLTLAGPLLADLHVSTSGGDSDWVVKLIDVFPDDAKDYPDMAKGRHLGGYQMMVRSEVIRGRFRNSPEKPEPFTPNQPAAVKLELLDVLHTFARGHRVMVQIQSTWFPLVDRNPQKYVENIFLADDTDFVKATQRVYRTKKLPSALRVGVLPPG